MKVKSTITAIFIIAIFFATFTICSENTEDLLNQEERIWLSKHDKLIRLGPDPNAPPLDFFDESGNYRGLTADYVRLIEKKLGFSFDIVRMDSWNALLESARKREIDVICAAKWTPARDKYLLFTKPFIHIPEVIITRQEVNKSLSIEDLRNKTVTMVEGYAVLEIAREMYPWLDIETSENDLDGLLKVSFNKSYAMLIDLTMASYLIEKEGIGNLRVAGYTDIVIDLAFASRKDLPILNSILEKGLALVTQQERDAIYKKWIHLKITPFYKTKKFKVFISIISIIISLVILIFFLLNRTLKQQVMRRTARLDKSNKLLRASEQRYRLIAENVADVIWTMDVNLNFNYISPSIYQQTGYTAEEAMELYFKKLLLPESLEKMMNMLTQKLALAASRDDEGYKPVEFEVEQLRKCGTIIWTSNNVRILSGPDKKPATILGITRDITERKQAEKAIRSSEAKYRELFEQSPIGLAMCRMDGMLVSINPAYADIIGYSMDEVLTLSSWDITPGKYTQNEKRQLYQIESSGRYGPYEKEYIHKDGHLVPVRLNGMIVVRDGEKFIWSSVEDISALKKAEKDKILLSEKLRQSQKMEAIGTLAGGIAHDFNNILFPILGYTEMLLEDIPEDSSFRDSLNKILAGSLRAKELAKQILTFSRQESNGLKLIKIQSVITEALKLIRATIPTTIDIKQDLQVECGAIKADPTQIHQIIMNLITNAYHATDKKGGEVKISLKEVVLGKLDLINPDMKPGPYACLTIADKGIGIDKDIIEKIFDPFFTTKEKTKGTGMGLSVVHGIVNSMHGAIQVNSEPGQGSEFKLYFPVENSFPVKQNSQKKESFQTGTERILLVDDEKSIITMEKQMLTRLGYQVTSCTNSLKALEIFRSNPDQFDLVITDMAMPGLAGDKLSGELVQIRHNIPILICTGFSESMSKEMARPLGIKGFLMKPAVRKDLAQKIREVLDDTKGKTQE